MGWRRLVGACSAVCWLACSTRTLYEYVLHRFFLHWGNGFLVQRHALHHNSTGTAEEPRYVNFATSPLVVVALFVGNAVPFFLLDHFLHADLAAGALVAFTIYYLLYEEVHWRFHLGGWLPHWMQRRAIITCCITEISRAATTFSCRSATGFSTAGDWKRGAMIPH